MGADPLTGMLVEAAGTIAGGSLAKAIGGNSNQLPANAILGAAGTPAAGMYYVQQPFSPQTPLAPYVAPPDAPALSNVIQTPDITNLLKSILDPMTGIAGQAAQQRSLDAGRTADQRENVSINNQLSTLLGPR